MRFFNRGADIIFLLTPLFSRAKLSTMIQNIVTEIERCKQIEQASATRGLNHAAQAYAGRRAALEWALEEIRPTKPGAAPAAQTNVKVPQPKKGGAR